MKAAVEPGPIRRRGRRRGPGKWYYIFLAVVGVGTLSASTAVGLLVGYVNSLPPIDRLEHYDPPEVSLVYDRTGARVIGQFSAERRQVIPVEKIPEQLKRAVLAIEDERFYDHFGIDPRAVVRSLLVNYRTGSRRQGASTITMQLPRNILPERVGREKTWHRKIDEVFLTFQIERRYSKDQILEFYLNHIFMGRNSYGLYAAAETYFSKTPDELNLAECATLAAIPKAPSIYNPLADPERARQRRDLILDRMRALGWIDDAAYETAVASPLATRPAPPRVNAAQSEFPYFVDGLERDLAAQYQITRRELERQGLRIYAAVDPAVQRIAEEELAAGLLQAERQWQTRKTERFWEEARDLGPPAVGQTRLARVTALTPEAAEIELDGYVGRIELPARLPYHEPENVLKVGGRLDVTLASVNHVRRKLEARLGDTARLKGAVVVLDAQTAEVLALVGGHDFRDAEEGGQFNRAMQGGRPAGSTVKPFFYAAALSRGFAPNDLIIDEPVIYGALPRLYRPRNYENRFFGPTTLLTALEHSRNVVTVRLFETVGVKRALAEVVRFDPEPTKAAWNGKFRPELPVCLGTVDMSPLELASAYLVFVNQGVARRPQFFIRIADAQGRALYSPRRQEQLILDEAVAAQMVYMLRQVVLNGTGKLPIGDRFPEGLYPPIAGKTGTTDNTTDAWFVGFTPDLVIVVYIGYDAPRTLGPQMTGGRVAGPIWANVFERVHALRDEWRMSFAAPLGLDYADICGRTGKLVSDVCRRGGHAPLYLKTPFKRGQAPRELCDGTPRPPIAAPRRGEAPIPVENLFGFTREER